MDPAAASLAPPRRAYRHRWPTRVWHWANLIVVTIMLMSGLMILNAHPRLYWGHYGANADHAWLVIGGGRFPALPGWMTIPSYYSLSAARIWHFAFAWLLVPLLIGYLLWSLLGGHLRRDLWLSRDERRASALWHDLREHAALRFPKGEAALRYNLLQKLLYGLVLLVLLPLMVASGLAMAPAMDAAWPWLVDLLGGRQSARSLHFIAAMGLVSFTLIHLLAVLLAGPWNHVRAMLTGWFAVPQENGT
ncbi:MAG: cytochrome b/b6 domain-containing protein [Sphingomonadales bacterium]|nr:cytochrome b/b6 domain-containing protein [Sphingomonadales bacterium]